MDAYTRFMLAEGEGAGAVAGTEAVAGASGDGAVLTGDACEALLVEWFAEWRAERDAANREQGERELREVEARLERMAARRREAEVEAEAEAEEWGEAEPEPEPERAVEVAGPRIRCLWG